MEDFTPTKTSWVWVKTSTLQPSKSPLVSLRLTEPRTQSVPGFVARLDAWKLCPGRNYLNGSLILKKSISCWYPINIHFFMGCFSWMMNQIYIFKKLFFSPFPSIKKTVKLRVPGFPNISKYPPPRNFILKIFTNATNCIVGEILRSESIYPTNSPLTILTTKITRMSCWNLETILSKLGCFTYLGDLQPTYIGVK